jgi:serine/threonine protein kinase
MAISVASVVTTCSVCGKPLNTKGECLACLIRAALDGSAAKSAQPVSLVFGDFELVRREDGSLWELGRGAFGVTYLAVDNVLRRKVALKVINVPAAARMSRAVRERFLREARAAAALRHPNVAAVFQFGASPDGLHCYYAMELVEGETLETRVRRDGPLDGELALEIASQVSRALVAASAHGLIHRDLKPGNIMLTWGEADTAEVELKVIDFGLAKAIADAQASDIADARNPSKEMDLTHGEFVGTPSFASPEQLGSGPVDVRSDIYSLGATLWFALTGKPPFSGRSIEEIRRAQQSDALPVEQLKAAGLPSRFKSLLKSMLAIEPAARPAIHELAARLRNCSAQTKGIRRTRVALAAFIVILGVSAFFVFPSLRNQNSALEMALPEKSIAVLPFENLSEDEENAFFAGGMQDEILTNLAKVADLKVISRTSVMKYKSGLERNLREIAKTLGVSHVVEGSVQRAGGRILIRAQLIDARTDTHLWAEHYDRDAADVFAIQSEIAQQIVNQLRAKLSAAEKAAIAERPTADPVAYALYTEAKAIGDQYDWEGEEKPLNREVELLEKATQRDPSFALAYCALAKTQCDLFSVTGAGGTDLSRTHLELAKKAADAALRVRPDLGEAHLELARYYFYAGILTDTGDFDRAHDELVIARRTLPNDSEAIYIAARIDRRQNRWDDSLANFRKASELDPRNSEIAVYRWGAYLDMRRYKELEQLFAKDATSGTLQDPWTQLWLAELKLAEGDPGAAQALLAQVPLDFSPLEKIWDIRFMAALYIRDYDAANRVIAATPAKFAYVLGGQPPESWADGQVAAARGDNQKALAVFVAARKRLDATWETKVKDESYFAEVAHLDAGLGRKEEAIREARRAVDLKPIAKDSVTGPGLIANLALVYAWTGERDRALAQLEIVATIPAGPSYGDLRFNPCWDSLRGDKRFDKIVAAAKAASR